MNELMVYVNALKSIADTHYGKEVIFYDNGDWYSRDHCRNLTPEEVATYVIETTINCLKEEDEECSEADPSITDILANLAHRVHSFESQLRDTQGNVEKLAEELATVKHQTQPQSVEVVTFEKFLDSIADKVAERLVGR